MLQKTIETLYSSVVKYLREHYMFDTESKYPRSQVYDEYVIYQKQNNTAEIDPSHMGYVVRYAFPRAVGTRTRTFDVDGTTRTSCYFLKKILSSNVVEPTVDTPILKPAIDEMKDFNAFILSINDLAENHGAIKIIPPQEWRNKTANFNSLNIIPIFQDVNLLNDEIYIQSHERFKSTTSVKAFWDLSDNENNRLNMDQRETMFWEEITKKRNIYAPDIEASLFDVKQKIFNMNLLNDLVSRERDENKNTINGVNTPFLYFGSFGTSFAFHVEDYNLYSMSYLHWGAPKSWYVVPPRDGKKMEKLARKYLSSYQCKDAIKHKIFLPSPRSLVANDIRFGRIRQEEGEFVVTFPYGYHGGFNNGNNIAEAINFGTRYWYENLEFGYKASKNICQCKQFDLKFGFDETTLRNLI